ncbi:hypothetical protein BB559_005883 [Furculomyces boomerangus]|uniref:Replication factor C subunit 5 n=1 Tax=Furculomyces boomerangus TaxID=61424 RepID=A0A2T9Y631_9FUNG|nr:hypothetical protein BB559_005883 [Furculomyces boomerangus]
MALWVDKDRPNTLDKLSHHPELTKHLKKMAITGDIPHMLFYGPEGAGKKTRINALLRQIFGPSAEKIKIDQRTFQTPSNRSLEINVISSNYHIEINPSDAGIYDRVVVQELIKEIAQTQQVNVNAPRKFKVVIIHEAESLTKVAQHALRRTMEKYMRNLRIIMCCSSTGNIILPLQSRCLLVRVPAPGLGQISQVLMDVAQKENIQLTDSVAHKMALASNQNLRRAILMLEAAYVTNCQFQENMELPLPDWEIVIKNLGKTLLNSQSPMVVMQSRSVLYELLTHCIPPSTILKKLAFYLVEHVDEAIKPEIVFQAAIYEERLRQGQKAIFHLEAFVAKFQSLYTRFLLDLVIDF